MVSSFKQAQKQASNIRTAVVGAVIIDGIILESQNKLGQALSKMEAKAAQGAVNAEQKVIQVTKDGIALPPGRTIPDDLIENPYRSGSYGKINPKTGKFEEELRIDPPTPKGKKGPDYSHYHLKDTDGHLSPKPGDKDPWPGKK